ncbi:MAG: VanZ family protein [Eubacteriales bacterium]
MYFNQIVLFCQRAFSFAFVIAILFMICYLIYHKKKQLNVESKTIFLWTIYIFYITSLIQITVIRDWNHFFDYKNYTHTMNTIQLVPFLTTMQSYRQGLDAFIYHLIGNMIWFLPLGCITPLVHRKFKGFFSTVIIGVFLSFFIELFQWVFNSGVSDLDDIIVNTLGTIVGYGIYICISKKKMVK